MTPDEKRRERARQMRYKKPIARDLNLEAIQCELWDIYEECSNVQYADPDDETLIDALGGDEDEAYEFRMMFSDLSAECEQMLSDLQDEWVPECFDKFFVAMKAGNYLGYDSYEQDYFGISGICADEFVENEAAKSMERMTKSELISAARQCFKVYQAYIGLRYRYDCLSASLAILREKNIGNIKMIKRIEEMYEQAERETMGFKYTWSGGEDFERMLKELPQEVWVW